MAGTQLDSSLIQAFEATEYKVHAQPPFVLKIGQSNDALQRMLKERNLGCAAYVTACNPYSQDVGEAENALLHRKLARELTNRGFVFFPGIGQDSQGNWPGEPSYLVLGLELEAAKTMGRQYKQNALVWCGADAVPQLILLR